jgi:hypothetical protein
MMKTVEWRGTSIPCKLPLYVSLTDVVSGVIANINQILHPHSEAKQAFRRLRGKELHLLRLRFASKCPFTRIAIIINIIINTI